MVYYIEIYCWDLDLPNPPKLNEFLAPVSHYIKNFEWYLDSDEAYPERMSDDFNWAGVNYGPIMNWDDLVKWGKLKYQIIEMILLALPKQKFFDIEAIKKSIWHMDTPFMLTVEDGGMWEAYTVNPEVINILEKHYGYALRRKVTVENRELILGINAFGEVLRMKLNTKHKTPLIWKQINNRLILTLELKNKGKRTIKFDLKKYGNAFKNILWYDQWLDATYEANLFAERKALLASALEQVDKFRLFSILKKLIKK